MKNFNIVLIVCLLTCVNSNTFAQRVQKIPESSENVCIKRYDVIIDGYYGLPFIIGAIYKQYITDSIGTTYIHLKNLNHFGGRFEYLVWDKIGFGLEYTYGLLAIKYEGKGNAWHKAGIAKQRVLAKFNFHFATGKKIDPYLTAGVGYTDTKFYTDEPGQKTQNLKSPLIPAIAIRVGTGFRFFFTDMVGLNVEVGLGGPLVQGGLSFKF